ncbi:MAG: MATE family efflux transporter [Paludibacteraceae bacterium]|nr:MATE family efflux transporter [Paludibacteraceae bacterium]
MKLGESPIPKLLWYYSLPSLIGTLVNALYNIIDRIYIGQGVGALAISGLALTFPIMNLLGAFGMLVGHGAAARVSLLLGNNNKQEANAILPNTLFLSLFFYLIVSSLTFIFLEPILYAFGASEQTLPYASEYLRIIIPGHIFTSLSYAYTNIMRASGHPMIAMNTLIMGALLNVLLDPIFIFWFNLGIKGAAYATVLSMFISCAWIMHYFFHKDNTLSFRKLTFNISQFSRQRLKDLRFSILNSQFSILSIGLSSFLLHTATSLVNVLMNHTLQNHGGDLAIGAFGIITSFTSLIVMSIVGMAQGMQPIVGYNYGAGHYDRVKTTLKYCVSIATIITTLGCITALIFPNYIARMFTTDTNLVNITASGLSIYASTFFVVGFHIIVTNYFQSIGRAGISIFLSISRQILLLIPFILLFPPIWGLTGAWMAQPASNIISAIIAVIILSIHLKKL